MRKMSAERVRDGAVVVLGADGIVVALEILVVEKQARALRRWKGHIGHCDELVRTEMMMLFRILRKRSASAELTPWLEM